MQPELRQLIERTLFHRAVIEQVIQFLPPDDAALDELLAEAVASNNLKVFMYVLTAAAGAERRMDARHLARGAMMFPEHRWLGKVAIRMHGDVPGHLLDAIENTKLDKVCEAAALHLIAAWCEEHRGGTLPGKLIPLARAAARKLKPNSKDEADLNIMGLLRALAKRTKDEGLKAVLRQRFSSFQDDFWNGLEDKAQQLGESVLKTYREPVLDLVADKPKSTLADGSTMRRAVARIGRNDPCPCGSGKKYKHCCIEKDQERLQHSSDVAGLTQEELYAQIEEHLTADRLEKTEPYEIARLDPRKIPPELERKYFTRLCLFNLFDGAATAFELLGYTPERDKLWHDVVFMATRAGHKDSIRRLVKIYPDPVKLRDVIFTGAALLLAEDNPAELLKLLDESVTKALAKNEPEELEGSAIALMYSRFRVLGILVGRGAIPILPQKMASRVFEEILTARDRLNLPPDDPFSDIMDKRLAEHEAEDGKDVAELRKSRRLLEVKAQEVRELKDTLERLQTEIVRREKKATAAPAPAVHAPVPVDETTLKEMRRKVDELKSALKERHHERNELRRELQKAQTSLEEIHNQTAPMVANENNGHDVEDSLLLPPDAPEIQPIRLIEFPKHFSQTLAPFPRHVARAAMMMIGRLAAGDPAAYVGALRLKATPNVMRQRIGSDYRLLFRLWPERMEVIDLINRKDLDRRIKTLV